MKGFYMSECKPIFTPLEHNVKLNSREEVK